MILEPILLFLFGLLALYKGGDFVVDGACKLARYFHVPQFIVGLTLLAFGTSLPELIVNIFATINNRSNIIFGNVLGSNISNILLILGLSAVFYPIVYSMKKKAIINILISFFTYFLLVFLLLVCKEESTFLLSTFGGLVLLFSFIAYIYWIARDKKELSSEDNNEQLQSILIPILTFVAGLAILPLGGHFIIKSVTDVAVKLNISTAFISLFVLSIGTSLPELATCLVAAAKKQYHLVLGNIIGSNIFNILLILGACSLMKPLEFPSFFFQDLIWTLISSIMLLFSLVFCNELTKKFSIVFLMGYAIYVFMLFDRFL